eukprot:1315908-Amorphochlora_amoeboformis.AAC.1
MVVTEIAMRERGEGGIERTLRGTRGVEGKVAWGSEGQETLRFGLGLGVGRARRGDMCRGRKGREWEREKKGESGERGKVGVKQRGRRWGGRRGKEGYRGNGSRGRGKGRRDKSTRKVSTPLLYEQA